MVTVLQRGRRTLAVSLAEAQQLFDAAPDLALSRLFAQSVVSQVLHARAEQLESSICRWFGQLIFSADTLSGTDPRWADPPSVIGVHGSGVSLEGIVVVRSDEVDADRLTWPRPAHPGARGMPPTEAVVYDVWPGFHELGPSAFRRVRQGTVLSEVCLDGRGLEARQIGSRQDLWCGSADHEWEGRGRTWNN
jgi:hypothetical protein